MPSFNSLDDIEIESIIDFLIKENKDTLSNNKSSWPYPYSFGGFKKMYAEDGFPAIKPPWGQLTAINMNNASAITISIGLRGFTLASSKP